METLGHKVRAYLYAFLVHAFVLAALFFGLFWSTTATPVATPGPVIEAELIGPARAPIKVTSKTPPAPTPAPPPTPPPPVPAPTPPPPPAPTPAPAPTVQHNDQVDQEKIEQLAQQKADDAKRAQEEKRKQRQIELDEQQKRDEIEAKRKADLQKQIDDIRAKREQAAKQTRLAQQKLQQLDDISKQQAAPPPKRAPAADVPEADKAATGMNGNDASKAAEYYSAIQLAVNNNWMRPENAPTGLKCRVHIIQIPGGTVLSANIVPPCSVETAVRTSIEQAVMRASPLPFQGFEKEFRREINLDFTYDGR